MRWSVVVPTFERPDLLRVALEALGADRGWPPERELVVADDGRRRPARAELEAAFPGVRWVQGPGRGPGANRNAGAAQARGDWLAFVDDDCRPASGWLEAFEAAAADRGETPADVLEGRTVADRPRQSVAEHAPINERGGCLWSCNLAVRREVFLRLGGFDEQFRTAMEDNDFALRLRQAGAVARFVPAATVVHPWRLRQPGRDGWKTPRGYIEDVVRFVAKHPGQRATLSPWRFARVGLRRWWADSREALLHHRGRGLLFAQAQAVQELRTAWALRRLP